MCPVKYDPKALCPRWEQFLEEIFDHDRDLIAYMKRVIGYALTGDVSAKAIFCLYGEGNNGKTTLLEIIRFILAAYAGQVMIETLLAGNSGRTNAMADLADLRGARFVTTSESDSGAFINESLIKQLTGMGQLKTVGCVANRIRSVGCPPAGICTVIFFRQRCRISAR
jgi:putative DNA primase/helicase